MSQTTTTTAPTPPASDTVATVSKLAVSILSQIVFMGALAIAYYTEDKTSQALLVGAVVANATTVMNYWLGSSQGSSSKDAAIAQITTPSMTTTRTTQP